MCFFSGPRARASMTRFVLLSPAARAARSAPLMVGAALAALVVLAPLVSLALHALGADVAHWAHLVDYVLPQALANTCLLYTSPIPRD